MKVNMDFLPGVPREMKALATAVYVSMHYKINGKMMIIQSVTLRFIGIGESNWSMNL